MQNERKANHPECLGASVMEKWPVLNSPCPVFLAFCLWLRK